MSGSDPWAAFPPTPQADPWSAFPAAAPAAAQPVTTGQSVAQGLTDHLQGGAQLLVNAAPDGVVDAVNGAAAWANRLPVLGPLTRAIGMTPASREDINAQTTAREQQYQASRAAAGETGFDFPRMAGQVVPAVAAALATRNPQTLLGAAGQGAAQGAVQGALEPVAEPGDNYWSQKAGQAALGGGFGAVGGGVGHAVGRVIAPNANPQAQALHAAGVELTPGMAAGGVVRTTEDALTSAPVVGGVVRGAQRDALNSFNVAVANRVLRPLGETVPDTVPAGRDLVEFVGTRIGQTYDDAIARANPFAPDQRFAQDLAAIGQEFMTPNSRTQYNAIVRDRVLSRLESGQIEPATYQTIRSDLGTLARRFGASQDPHHQEMSEGFGALQKAFDELLARSNPQIARDIRAANTAWAGFVRMSDAAGRQGANNGVFSASHLSSAVQRGDASARRSAYSRGDALLQDLSDAGRAILPSTVPDSGTPVRLATLAGLGMVGNQAGIPMSALATGGAALGAYTPLGQRLLTGAMLAQRPAPVRAAGRLVGQAGAPVAVPLGDMWLSPPSP